MTCVYFQLRELIALLETQGPGTLACLQGASTVSGIIADLDTTILFASSGTLHPPIRDDLDMHQLEERRSHGYFAPLTAGSGSMDDFGREQDNFISIRYGSGFTIFALLPLNMLSIFL